MKETKSRIFYTKFPLYILLSFIIENSRVTKNIYQNRHKIDFKLSDQLIV